VHEEIVVADLQHFFVSSQYPRGKEVKRMKIGSTIAALVFSIMIAGVALAQEKNGTVSSFDADSRMVVIKGKDWEQKAKVSSKDADGKKDLLKDGAKVKVEFEDRGGGDVRVKSISPR
jgi:hypothetical protein